MTGNQEPKAENWTRMWFKENKVWMATDSQGVPITKNGRVLINYQIKQDYEYWVDKNNDHPLNSPQAIARNRKKRKAR